MVALHRSPCAHRSRSWHAGGACVPILLHWPSQPGITLQQAASTPDSIVVDFANKCAPTPKFSTASSYIPKNRFKTLLLQVHRRWRVARRLRPRGNNVRTQPRGIRQHATVSGAHTLAHTSHTRCSLSLSLRLGHARGRGHRHVWRAHVCAGRWLLQDFFLRRTSTVSFPPIQARVNHGRTIHHRHTHTRSHQSRPIPHACLQPPPVYLQSMRCVSSARTRGTRCTRRCFLHMSRVLHSLTRDALQLGGNMHRELLKAYAGFNVQVMRHARRCLSLHGSRKEVPVLSLTIWQYCPQQSFVTGAWGCGAFKGDR